jgi:hypothetical protein
MAVPIPGSSRNAVNAVLTEKYPLHVVCAWMGNSQPVAAKHYLQIRDEDFERAAQGDAFSDAPMTQNPTQTGSATTGQEPQETQKAPKNQGFFRFLSTGANQCTDVQIPPRGVEPLFSD